MTRSTFAAALIGLLTSFSGVAASQETPPPVPLDSLELAPTSKG